MLQSRLRSLGKPPDQILNRAKHLRNSQTVTIDSFFGLEFPFDRIHEKANVASGQIPSQIVLKLKLAHESQNSRRFFSLRGELTDEAQCLLEIALCQDHERGLRIVQAPNPKQSA